MQTIDGAIWFMTQKERFSRNKIYLPIDIRSKNPIDTMTIVAPGFKSR